MFYIATNNEKYNHRLQEALIALKLPCKVLKLSEIKTKQQIINKSNDQKVSALITSPEHPKLSQKPWHKILQGISQQGWLYLATNNKQKQETLDLKTIRISPKLTEIPNTAKEIVHAFLRDQNTQTNKKNKQLAFLTHSKVAALMKKQKNLSIITIDLSDFDVVATNYGATVHNKIIQFIKETIVESWGAQDFFRKTDLLLQDKDQKNLFYIILSPSRLDSPIVKPGKLKEVSKRIEQSIESKLWLEFDKSQNSKVIPPYLNNLPKIKVGYSTNLHYLGKDTKESTNKTLAECRVTGRSRLAERKLEEKEILQYIIASSGLLTPHFQAIIDITSLKQTYDHKGSSSVRLYELKECIYGYESLIRVNNRRLHQDLHKNNQGFLNLNNINPEHLFELAKKSNLSLELDYKCIEEAFRSGKQLSGPLFVNILPRNFYLIETLQKIIPANKHIVFELSETEIINNFSLAKELRKRISSHKCSLAIDDFGKGYSGFERILRLKPDIIKIDKILIKDIHIDQVKQDFIDSLLKGIKRIGAIILAEGVETKEEFLLLKKMGVHLAQGYFFHKPNAPQEITKELKKPKRKNKSDAA